MIFRRFRNREPEPAPPSDAEVGDSMAGLAAAFLAGLAREGHQLDHAVENAARLDALVDLFVAVVPPLTSSAA